jgi:hypothetical protein
MARGSTPATADPLSSHPVTGHCPMRSGPPHRAARSGIRGMTRYRQLQKLFGVSSANPVTNGVVATNATGIYKGVQHTPVGKRR